MTIRTEPDDDEASEGAGGASGSGTTGRDQWSEEDRAQWADEKSRWKAEWEAYWQGRPGAQTHDVYMLNAVGPPVTFHPLGAGIGDMTVDGTTNRNKDDKDQEAIRR